jgi:hypothetical protein
LFIISKLAKTMDVISFEYTKQRRDFGRHPTFGDSRPQLISLFANKEDEEQWTERAVTTTELDCVPTMSEHWVCLLCLLVCLGVTHYVFVFVFSD